jgi:hypothetical protein
MQLSNLAEHLGMGSGPSKGQRHQLTAASIRRTLLDQSLDYWLMCLG